MGRSKLLTKRKTIDVYKCASTFYSLQALKAMVMSNEYYSPFRHSHERLMNDIKDFEKELSDSLAKILYDYITIVCYGEFTHCTHASIIKYKNAGFDENFNRPIERENKYQNSLKYNPESILKICVKSFSNNWRSGYGGKKWKMIAEHGLRYGKIDNVIFCDTAFSLSHNSSPFVDKSKTGVFFLDNTREYKRMLDTKFEKSPFEVIEYFNGIHDYNIYNLIKRIGNLHLYTSESKYQNSCCIHDVYNIMDEIKSYIPIKFGNKKFKNIKTMYTGTTNLKESQFLEKLYIGQPCIILDETSYIWDWDTEYYKPYIKNNNNFSELFISEIDYRSGQIIIKNINYYTYSGNHCNFVPISINNIAVLTKDFKTLVYNRELLKERIVA